MSHRKCMTQECSRECTLLRNEQLSWEGSCFWLRWCIHEGDAHFQKVPQCCNVLQGARFRLSIKADSAAETETHFRIRKYDDCIVQYLQVGSHAIDVWIIHCTKIPRNYLSVSRNQFRVIFALGTSAELGIDVNERGLIKKHLRGELNPKNRISKA